MHMTLPKLAALASFAAFGLAGSWLALGEGPTTAYAMKPCAPLQDVSNLHEAGEPLSPLAPYCGPLEMVDVTSADESNTEQDTEDPQAAPPPAVSYYSDGDVVGTEFRTLEGELRSTGSYAIVFRKPAPKKSVDTPSEDLEDLRKLAELRLALKEHVNELEKVIETKKIIPLEETCEFDPARVPPGVTVDLVKDSTWIEYRQDGTRVSETTYRVGKRDGLYARWHEDGTLAQSGSYLDDKQSARWLNYGTEGQLVSEQTFDAGQLHGHFAAYHPDGRVAATGQYENGTAAGIWTLYDPDGVVQRIDHDQIPNRKTGKRVNRIVVPEGETAEGRSGLGVLED